MKHRRKSAPSKDAYSPLKKARYGRFDPLEAQAYKYVWIGFFIVHTLAVLFGLFCRISYLIGYNEYPDRKAVQTFTQIKLINTMMLIWPVFLIIGTIFTSEKDEMGNDKSKYYKKAFRLNVVCQVILTHAVYYGVFFTTERMKEIAGQDVASGHIFVGFLASGSFLSITIFICQFKDKSSQAYKIFQLI